MRLVSLLFSKRVNEEPVEKKLAYNGNSLHLLRMSQMSQFRVASLLKAYNQSYTSLN